MGGVLNPGGDVEYVGCMVEKGVFKFGCCHVLSDGILGSLRDGAFPFALY